MGYLIIDQRASHEGVREYDTVHCPHCQRVIDKAVGLGQAHRVPRDFCAHCGAAVCVPCKERMQTEGCTPFRKRIDALIDARARREAWLRS